jgi:hypothetical protein
MGLRREWQAESHPYTCNHPVLNALIIMTLLYNVYKVA